MQNCKSCGKPSVFEYCFKCRHKALGLRATEKTPCVVCGKPTSGVRCKECRSKQAYKNNRKHCVDCGKELCLSYSEGLSRCFECSVKWTAKQRHEEALQRRKDDPEFIVCAYCGKKFPFRRRSSTNKPVKVCSYSCATKLKHLKAGHTKEAMVEKIIDFITQQGKYVSESGIKQGLGITRQQLRRYDISTVELNRQLGYEEVTKGYIKQPKHSKGAQTRLVLGEQAVEHSEVGEALKQRIVDWIREQNTQVTIRQILRAFHIDYYSVWCRYGFDNPELHALAGVQYSRTSSWYERAFVTLLRQSFGAADITTQKRFATLYGDKGWPLRYDVYIRSRNCLVEVDGEQHYEGTHVYSRASVYDDRKQEYAQQHGIPLLRLRVAPTNTFTERAQALINQIQEMDVVKESELLESYEQPDLFG